MLSSSTFLATSALARRGGAGQFQQGRKHMHAIRRHLACRSGPDDARPTDELHVPLIVSGPRIQAFPQLSDHRANLAHDARYGGKHMEMKALPLSETRRREYR